MSCLNIPYNYAFDELERASYPDIPDVDPSLMESYEINM